MRMLIMPCYDYLDIQWSREEVEERTYKEVPSVRPRFWHTLPAYVLTLVLCPSPRWYNIPPDLSSKRKNKAAMLPPAQNGTEIHLTESSAEDSTPLNFDTFVPTHDPSLSTTDTTFAAPSMGMNGVSSSITAADMAMVSQDEAFSRAMTAMYWSGYWTAIYHVSFSPFLIDSLIDVSHVQFRPGGTRPTKA